jgi:hypothetical protein
MNDLPYQNDLPQEGETIMIFNTFNWGVGSVSLPLCTSWLCRRNVIFICDGNASLIQIMKLCIGNCSYSPKKNYMVDNVNPKIVNYMKT